MALGETQTSKESRYILCSGFFYMFCASVTRGQHHTVLAAFSFAFSVSGYITLHV
jgi:hypothetical protein